MPSGQYTRTPRGPYKIPRETKPVTPIGPSIAYVPLGKDLYSLIDRTDVDSVSEFNWHAMWNPLTESFYAKRSDYSSGRCRGILLATWLVGQKADHANHNTLDDRRSCNLRPATHGQNAMNRRRRQDNTSGVKGVSFAKKQKKWTAYISANGQREFLGYFDSKSEAAARREKRSSELHGKFACH